MRTVIAVLVALAGAPAVAQPAAGIYELRPERSSARLTVGSPVGAAAATIPAAGAIEIGADGTVTGGRLVLDAAAMRADGLVAQQLRGPEGLDVRRHPQATIALDGGVVDARRIRLDGRLTVRGTTRRVSMSGAVERAAGRRFTAVLTGTLDRTEFGVVAGRPLYDRRAAVRLRLVAVAPRR